MPRFDESEKSAYFCRSLIRSRSHWLGWRDGRGWWKKSKKKELFSNSTKVRTQIDLWMNWCGTNLCKHRAGQEKKCNFFLPREDNCTFGTTKSSTISGQKYWYSGIFKLREKNLFLLKLLCRKSEFHICARFCGGGVADRNLDTSFGYLKDGLLPQQTIDTVTALL